MQSPLNDTHRQPVPYSYGLFPFLFVTFFQRTPRAFKNAPEKIHLGAHSQDNQLSIRLFPAPCQSFSRKRFPKITAAGICAWPVGFLDPAAIRQEVAGTLGIAG